MERHISQTSRSHLNMIENLYKLQLQQNEALQRKLNDAERKLKAYKDKFGEIDTRSKTKQLTNNSKPTDIQQASGQTPETLHKQNCGAIPKRQEL